VVFNEQAIDCQSQQVCNFELEQHELTLKWSEDSLKLQSSHSIDFTVSVIEGATTPSNDTDTVMHFSSNSGGLILESGHQRLTINIVSP
jgi:hypothetical protein